MKLIIKTTTVNYEGDEVRDVTVTFESPWENNKSLTGSTVLTVEEFDSAKGINGIKEVIRAKLIEDLS